MICCTEDVGKAMELADRALLVKKLHVALLCEDMCSFLGVRELIRPGVLNLFSPVYPLPSFLT